MDGLLQTREDLIDLKHSLMALTRKAHCRQVNCDIIDQLAELEQKFENIENDLTQIIGD